MKQKKMTAFLLSAAMAVSAFAAITVTASAEEPITIINGNYEILSATAYTEASTKKLNTESWGFNVEYNNGWDDGNGIKIELPNMSGKKGTFAVSVDVKSYGWGDSESNTAKVFIENAEGAASDTVLEAYGGNEVADEYGGRTATISGNIEYDATAAGTYYLCIKHPSGSQQYQNISVMYTAAETDEPGNGGDEDDGIIFAPNSADVYAALAVTPYDSAEAPFDGDLTFKDWGIEAKYNNNGYNGNTGVKIDITDAIKGKKGTFAVSADFTAYYWGDDLADGDAIASYNQVKLFLETGDGTQTEIAQGPDTKNGNDAALSGEVEYDATAETTYYLCFKQPSSTHEYKNIVITYTAAESVDPADGGDEDDGIIFAPNSADVYAALAVTPYDSTEAPFDGDLTFKDWGIEAKYNNNGYNGNTGVKIDITDAIKGKKGTFAVSADFTAYYWGDDLTDGDAIASYNQVKLFLETGDGTQTEIAQGPDTKNGNDAALSGEIEYDATAETTYYLCFKQPSSTHEYKNIVITYTAAESVDPGDGGDEDDGIIFAPNSADVYAALAVTPYDSAEAPFDGDLTFKDWGIEAKYNNNGYNGNTGVKIDITDAIKGKKGTFAVSADFTAYYWGDDLADGDEIASWNQVKLFLETADGTQTEIAQGPDTKNGNDAALSGEIEYDATAETTYYLCFKQPSSTHEYKNITIKYTAPGALSATVPALTDTGAKTVISNTTDSDKEVFIYVVNNEGITLQTVTASANTENVEVTITASSGDTVYIWDINQTPLADKTVL